jgi:hypothetical protein
MKRKITNKLNLPEVFINVLMRDEYTRGNADISCTSLLLPPRIFQLRERHADEIEEDVADAIWKIFGKAIHKIKEEGAPLESLPEERLYHRCNGWTVSAAIDLYVNQGLEDYKVTSFWTVVYGSRVEEWHWQLEYNRLMWLNYNFKVNRLRNILLLRDWSAFQAKKIQGCPQSQVHIIEHELKSIQEVEASMLERVKIHQSCVGVKDNELPLCTPEERWRKDEKWAVMKEGRKTALKVCSLEDEANELLDKQWKRATHIEHRKGEDVRCKDYCEVNKFCNYYQDKKGE